MSFLDSIPIIGDLFKDTTEIIKEAVVDKDLQNKIIESLDVLKTNVGKEIYVKELETKTIPWVDGVHKMGRQILNLASIVAVFTLSLMGHQITPTEAAVLTGGNIAYQIIKGKGQ